MNILVTGVAGFIGSHSAKHLVQAGVSVSGLDNLSTGHKENTRWGTFIQGDISDIALVRRIIRGHSIITVLHLAAFAEVAQSLAQPETYFINNVSGTHALLQAMISEGVRQFVFASSCSVYGVVGSQRVREEEPVHPLSPYGESKLSIERSLPWYESAHGLRWVALRYFNVAGAETGFAEPSSSIRIIPRSIDAALGRGPTLRVFGTQYPTADGTAVRDYVHVVDVAEANLCALQYLQNGRPSAVMNVGSGVGVSVRQIIDTVSSITGKPVPFIESQSRQGDAPVIVACPDRAMASLGWSPARSNINQIVEDTVTSYKTKLAGKGVSAFATPGCDPSSLFSPETKGDVQPEEGQTSQ
jgi:UDP-glucose-4-epimerase GalE